MFEPGALVRCREREWVVLPSEQADVLLLRPLGGSAAETCGIYLPLEGRLLQTADFPAPDPKHSGDFVSGWLLHNAARLNLRSGAGPFRSLGRLGLRPRPYQLVPLLMALRLDTVRLLIADDVGIGKTIEAGLIARELYDRGEIRRLTVLCPPHLCDQWQRELHEKFGFEAVVVRSSTAAALERSLPGGDLSLWEHYPITVASIDYVKSDRRRDNFLRAAPELLIVDEAHTATLAASRGATQQQRYDLVRTAAAQRDRHLLLLTATPHSGIEDAFRSLLGLLDPRFAGFDLERPAEHERDELARHFVQRRRADVRHWLDEDTPFPARESAELTYRLARAPAYQRLFNDVFAFTGELVAASADPAGGAFRRRARYWAALALLRCVMSSPAAAEKALRVRAAVETLPEAEPELDAAASDELFRFYVADSTDQEHVQDLEPAAVVEQGSPEHERSRLLRFATRAAALAGAEDPKLQALIPALRELLDAGHNPIVYCRYIATADYLAEQLGAPLNKYKGLRIIAVTGERSEEERESMIADLARSPRRLLVATDCLSEGINLQHAFDAVVHYDLPWNPNRLEQREGRVDRYGQPAAIVRSLLLYGDDNPMDQAVMAVLLRKAVRIHRTLGISVPLPVDDGSMVDVLIASLYRSGPRQASFFDSGALAEPPATAAQLAELDLRWEAAVEREKASRTRFAQRRIRPEEVARELQESDAALGDPATVFAFVRAACERLSAPLSSVPGSERNGRPLWLAPVAQLPLPVQERLQQTPQRAGRSTGDGSLALDQAELTRNHPLPAALADYLLESALTPGSEAAPAARSSMIVTDAVQRRTVLLLLRVRMLIESPRQVAPTLAEELVVCGFRGQAANPDWLATEEAFHLLETARPVANLDRADRVNGLQTFIDQLPALEPALNSIAHERADHLLAAHRRVRAQTGGGRVSVKAQLPVDVLGLYVLHRPL